jgi:hypothetical protein
MVEERSQRDKNGVCNCRENGKKSSCWRLLELSRNWAGVTNQLG